MFLQLFFTPQVECLKKKGKLVFLVLFYRSLNCTTVPQIISKVFLIRVGN